MLKIEGVEARYGAISALRGIDVEVRDGEIVGLLGANGAGKSTTMSVISGQMRPQFGSVYLRNERLDGLSPEDVCRRGIALVPERRRVFGRLTVGENLVLGATVVRDRAAVAQQTEKMFKRFPILYERASLPASTLSGGEQQQLAIARALMSSPELLLLDEPSLGLAPILVDEVFELISDLRHEGVTILLAEQSISRTLAIADRVYILANGCIREQGTAQELSRRSHYELAYLGTHPIEPDGNQP